MGTVQLTFTFNKDMGSHNARHKDSKNIGNVFVFKKQVYKCFLDLASKNRE